MAIVKTYNWRSEEKCGVNIFGRNPHLGTMFITDYFNKEDSLLMDCWFCIGQSFAYLQRVKGLDIQLTNEP